MKPTLSYDEAFSELEALVHQLEDDSIQLDTLAEKVMKANELIAICEAKLRAIEVDVEREKMKEERGKRKEER